MARPAVRLGGGGGGQVERHSPGTGRGRDRHRRGPDVTGGRVVPGGPQGASGGARPLRGRVSFRRVLSIPRRGRRSGPGGGAGDHSARRLRERREGRRRGRSAWSRDGVDRHPAVPALIEVTRMQERPSYLTAACVFLGTLSLYVLTLAPTTQFWDASEYLTA